MATKGKKKEFHLFRHRDKVGDGGHEAHDGDNYEEEDEDTRNLLLLQTMLRIDTNNDSDDDDNHDGDDSGDEHGYDENIKAGRENYYGLRDSLVSVTHWNSDDEDDKDEEARNHRTNVKSVDKARLAHQTHDTYDHNVIDDGIRDDKYSSDERTEEERTWEELIRDPSFRSSIVQNSDDSKKADEENDKLEEESMEEEEAPAEEEDEQEEEQTHAILRKSIQIIHDERTDGEETTTMEAAARVAARLVSTEPSETVDVTDNDDDDDDTTTANETLPEDRSGVGVSPDKFLKIVRIVGRQLRGAFGTLPLHKLEIASLPYYVQAEEARKTFTYKRKIHRGMPTVTSDKIHGLNDALYLAQVSFVNTIDDVRTGLSNYRGHIYGSTYELVYCSVQSKPTMPAHYIAIKKEKYGLPSDRATTNDQHNLSDEDDDDEKSSFFTLEENSTKEVGKKNHDTKKNKNKRQQFTKKISSKIKTPPTTTYLDVILCIRGTKTIDDYLSDAMLEVCDYDGGKSHHGVCTSGQNIYNKHLDLILKLLRLSGRSKVRLTLIGHSLGGGAAAIACIEFNKNHPKSVDAHCITFGCPALLSADLSKKWKKHITTVVNDSDMIPRMSGSTVVNLCIQLLEFDYSEYAMDDVDELANRLHRRKPQTLPERRKGAFANWVRRRMAKKVARIKARQLPRQEVILFPPGRCLHMYRDGVSIRCVEVPCTFFDEFDVTRTMVDNHKPPAPTGYYFTLLDIMRHRLHDPHFQFANDMFSLPSPANK